MWQHDDPENIYEGEVRYQNKQAKIANPRTRTGPLPGTPQSPVTTQQTPIDEQRNLRSVEEDRPNKWFLVITGLVAFVGCLVVAVIAMNGVALSQPLSTGSSNQTNPISQAQQQNLLPRSCLDHKKTGISESGMHSIAIGERDRKVDTFCDMETDGGGWTLVASIHENDINEKCDIKDRWATHVSPGYIGTIVKTNWENKLTFGKAKECTKDDYKNDGYHNMEVTDIMLWHVPSGTPISTMRDLATLRYRTTNKFLQYEGGNLYFLYNERYPLTKKKSEDRVIPDGRTRKVLDALYARRNVMKSKISYWHEYTFRIGNYYYINDDSLYTSRGGNRMHFGSSRENFGYLQYEKEYQYKQPYFIMGTKKSQPFMMVAAISNEDSLSSYFRTEVRSYPKDSSFTDEYLGNNISFHNFELQYRAVQYNIATAPTVCEFHFVVFNVKEWGSTPPSFFNRTYQNSGPYRQSRFDAKGSPANFVMGYLLLTRATGNKITVSQTDAIANVILDSISHFTTLFNEAILVDGLSVPVTFDKGDSSTILSMVPPVYRPFVEPGYLQFRAYNLTGYPNALCPGVKMKSFHPEYMCVGGLSEDVQGRYGTCGDFAGWGGKEGDAIQPSTSNGRAHSRSDISSTILIFYR